MNVWHQLKRARLVVPVTLCLLTLTVGVVNNTRSAHAQGPSKGVLAGLGQATPIRSKGRCGPGLPSARLPQGICDTLNRCCHDYPGGQCCIAYDRNCGGGQ